MAIELQVKSDSRQAQNDLRKLDKSVEQINKTTQNATKTIKSLAIGAAAAFAAISSGKAVTGITDSYRRLEARIALTNNSLIRQEYAFRKLNSIAIKTRSNQEGLADLYSRIGRATREMGVEQETVIKVTEAVAKAITISGSSAESANSAIVQLGQGLAAGALRGQELNSVMEQTPAVAQAIARGMGITIGELRAFANEGKLTAQAVVDALKDQGDAIDKEFSKVPVTFAQAMQVFSTGFSRVVNELDQVTGATGAAVRKFQKLGISLNSIAKPLAASLVKTINTISEFTTSVGNLVDPLLDLGSAFGTLAGTLASGLGINTEINLLDKLGNGINEITSLASSLVPSFLQINRFIVMLTNGIIYFSNSLAVALKPIKSFTTTVADLFFKVYDAVVGNSYWPDLIDGVIEYADKIKDALKPISTFASSVGKVFLGLMGLIGSVMAAIALQFVSINGVLASVGFGALGFVFNGLSNAINSLGDNIVANGIATLFDKMAKAAFGLVAVIYTITTAITVLAGGFGLLALGSWSKMVEGLKELTALDGVIRVIKSFGETVKDVFFDVYDAVVGNSYWPDMIDGVVGYASKIKDAMPPITEFLNGVAESFSNLLDRTAFSAKILLFIYSPLAAAIVALGFAFQTLGGPISTFSILSYGRTVDKTINGIQKSIEKGYNYVADGLTGIVQGAAKGVVGAVNFVNEALSSFGSVVGEKLSILIGAGILAGLIGVPAVLTALGLIISTTIREGVSSGVEGLSGTFTKIISTAGKFVGVFIAELISVIPSFAGVVVTFVSAIFESIVGEIPIIGKALAFIVNLTTESFNTLLNSIASIFVTGWLLKLFGLGAVNNLVAKGLKLLLAKFVAYYAAQKTVAATGNALLLANTTFTFSGMLLVIRTKLASMLVTITATWVSMNTRTAAAFLTLQLIAAGALTKIRLGFIALGASIAGGGIVAGIGAIGTAIVVAANVANAALARLLLNPIVAIIVGGTLLAGGLAVAIFGEGNSFLDKLDNIKKRLNSFFRDIFTFTKDPLSNVDDAVGGKGSKKEKPQFNMMDNLKPEGFGASAKKMFDNFYQSIKETANEGIDLGINVDNFGSEFVEKAKTSYSKVKDLFSGMGSDMDSDSLMNLRVSSVEKLATISDKIKKLKDEILNATALTAEQESEILLKIQNQEENAEKIKRRSKEINSLLKEQGLSQRQIRALTDEQLEALIKQKNLTDSLNKAVARVDFSKTFESIEKGGFSGTFTEFNSLTQDVQDRLTTLGTAISDISAQPIISKEELINLDAYKKELVAINEQLEYAKAGAEGFQYSFKTAFGDILKGTASIKDAFMGFLGDISSKIIDAGVDGLADRIMGGAGDGGGIDDMVGNAIGGVKSFFSGKPQVAAGGAATATLGGVAATSIPSVGGVGGGLGGMLGGMAPDGTEMNPYFVRITEGLMGGLMPGGEEGGGIADGAMGLLGGGGDEDSPEGEATSALSEFTASIGSAVDGVGNFISQTIQQVLEFFGLSVATTASTTAAASKATADTLGSVASNSLATSMLRAAIAAEILGTAMGNAARKSIVGFSTGGAVSGPGTGTSDSILAHLSNGEYVINAKSTKKYGPLIEAINSGNVPKFSTGGEVGRSLPVMNSDIQANMIKKAGSKTSPAQFNNNITLQVTGDVTEATRKAVRDMGDEITSNVQTHFRERGVLNG